MVQELRDLAAELEAHDDLYYNQDEPQISDAEYDALVQRMEELESRYNTARVRFMTRP